MVVGVDMVVVVAVVAVLDMVDGGVKSREEESKNNTEAELKWLCLFCGCEDFITVDGSTVSVKPWAHRNSNRHPVKYY